MTNKRPTFEEFIGRKHKICVVGLGYVGLPLAAAFAKCFDVTGFDISQSRVAELTAKHDRTHELSREQLREAESSGLRFSMNPECLSDSRFIVVTVPTPVDEHKIPDLTPLIRASELIGKYIKPGTTIVYESTVYPGCTEEDCLPVIERQSGLTWKVDFFAGYSPERINPGDKEHTVQTIKKVVSGDTQETASLVRDIYARIVIAGVFVAESIATAEAAKVIENTQRDLNIALMNELSLIFNRMDLNTSAVLEAAGTKWNFLPFKPGLVGGHCIGVDPYYLTYKAEAIGYHPQVILAGRRINDSMGKIVAEQTVKTLIHSGRTINGAKILILGWTFKEDVPDIRNTKVIDIYNELKEYDTIPLVFDPCANPEEAYVEYGIRLMEDVDKSAPYSAVVLAVRHRLLIEEFSLRRLKELGGNTPPVIADVKGYFHRSALREAGLQFWQL